MNTKTGRRLSDLRRAVGLSQEELAGEMGVSRQAISNWERSESVPDTANLVRLSEFYGVSLDLLVGREESVDNAGSDSNPPRSGDDSGGRAAMLRDGLWFAGCLVLSFAYFALISQPLLMSTADDITEIFGLSFGPALAVMWLALELIFVLVPFVVLAAAPLRVPHWIWIAPLAAFAVPVLVVVGGSALGGAATVEYSGIGGALMSSVALKADALALVAGSVLVAVSKGRQRAASSD